MPLDEARLDDVGREYKQKHLERAAHAIRAPNVRAHHPFHRMRTENYYSSLGTFVQQTTRNSFAGY